MAKNCTRILAAVFCLLPATAGAEEAILPSGKKQIGRLLHQKGIWIFRADQDKQIQLRELSYIRFTTKSTPLPNAPLIHTLLLANQQRVTGTLLRVEEKQLKFVASWGRTLVLPRGQVVGIEQANDSLAILHDDFEAPLKNWQVKGSAALDADRAFFGKSSLRLDNALPSATRQWQPPLRDGKIRLFFCGPEAASSLRWTFAIVSEKPRDPMPSFVVDQAGYACGNVKEKFNTMKATPGWHLLSIELDAGRVRIYVDDTCLGETALLRAEAIKGLRCTVDADTAKTGKLWIDELLVTQRLPPLPRPPSMPNQDSLWLVQGEQLFGRIVSADAKAVLLDAKFGKRSLPWTQLRGILFAQSKNEPASALPEITFRPSPGFAVDCLRAKLVRWDDTKLIVQHELLGEIAIERDRLDKIRFAAK